VAEQLKRFGMDSELLEPHNRALWEMGQGRSAADFLMAEAKMHEYLKRLMESWKTYNLILTVPTECPQVTRGRHERSSASWLPVGCELPGASLLLSTEMLGRLLADGFPHRPWVRARPGR